ncbi:hypothetical protein AG1IA_02905 [Rhizoctonia solani AG-1 IA]|uniref:Uncharacterized protein n=1 Tax=Thanatephorus cucumeris (strain AG1-IA) TaxID=983506 RepID=L8WYI7_THACA|nr:hypothetical protein AG1IA_02905 [Rhizoctonia solani AG-1 IA]
MQVVVSKEQGSLKPEKFQFHMQCKLNRNTTRKFQRKVQNPFRDNFYFKLIYNSLVIVGTTGNKSAAVTVSGRLLWLVNCLSDHANIS